MQAVILECDFPVTKSYWVSDTYLLKYNMQKIVLELNNHALIMNEESE